jgi:hypothetical protein
MGGPRERRSDGKRLEVSLAHETHIRCMHVASETTRAAIIHRDPCHGPRSFHGRRC